MKPQQLSAYLKKKKLGRRKRQKLELERKDANRTALWWWSRHLAPILVIPTFLFIAQLPIDRFLSFDLTESDAVSFSYDSPPTSYKSPACGCMSGSAHEWVGALMMFDELHLRQVNTLDQQSAYHFISPFPNLVSYTGDVTLPLRVHLYFSDDHISEHVQRILLTRELSGEELSEHNISVSTIRNAHEIVVLTDRDISLRSSSQAPYVAHIPRQFSTTTVNVNRRENGIFSWGIQEEVPPADEHSASTSAYTIFDLISDRTVLTGEQIQHVFVNNGRPMLEYSGNEYIVVIEAPFSLRMGVMNFSADDIEASMLQFGQTGILRLPLQSSPEFVLANVHSSEATENRALRVIERTPTVLVTTQLSFNGQPSEYRTMMAFPPVPHNTGMHIFGPISNAEIIGAEGDIVIGAEPYPTISAPSLFSFELDQSPENYTGPMPIRLEGTSSYLSSEYAALGRVSINGEAVTTVFNSIRGAWSEIFNVGALLGAVAWAVFFGVSFRSRPRFADRAS